jgi:hypothetical protein
MDAEEYVVYPDKYRLNLNTPMGTVVQAGSGKSVWMQQGDQTRDAPPPLVEEFPKQMTRALGVGLLKSALDESAELAAAEPVEIEGRKLNVAIWKQGDNTTKLFFDPQTKLVVRMAYRGVGMGGVADIEVAFADFRKVGNVVLPYSETIYQNGQKFADRVLSDRAVNAEIKPEIFVKP